MKVVSRDVGPGEIGVQPNSIWLPEEIHGDFLRDTLKIPEARAINGGDQGGWEFDAGPGLDTPENTEAYGVNHGGRLRMYGSDLWEKILELQADPSLGNGY